MVDQLKDIALIRTNLGEDPQDESSHVLPDSALATWLTAFAGNTDRVTWRALLTIAANETLLSKKITSQHLSTDGPAVSAELRALADTYKQVADEADSVEHFAGYVPPPVLARREAEELRWFR